MEQTLPARFAQIPTKRPNRGHSVGVLGMSARQVYSQNMGTRKPKLGPSGANRSFGLLLAVVLAVAGFWPWIAACSLSPALNGLALAGAAAALAAALLRPGLLGPATRAWLFLGRLLHRVSSPVAMGIVFFLVVTPLALVMRLTGKDPMRRRFEPETSSYWIRRDPAPQPDTMRNQF